MILLQKILEQLLLVGVSVSLAILIAVPLGIFSTHFSKFQKIMLGTVNVLQTIPSLAMLAALLPFFGIGMLPAFIALTLYALLPILKNTIIAFHKIPREYIEAAQNLGANRFQCLWEIELPLAMPLIMGGIRIATAMTIGIATIAAFIGAGGLGDFITRGLAMNNTHLLLMGAIPAALLALLLDTLFAYFEKKPSHSLGFFLIIIILIIIYFYPRTENADVIRIGTKNFTEQYILGEIIAERIEAKTHLKVIRKFNLGTTEICQTAISHNEIDIYPEYTGTAYMTILHEHEIKNPDATFKDIYNYYKKNYNIIWLKPFGFENTQALTVRENFAQAHHLKTISDLIPLAPTLTIGAPAEFADRADAYPALQKTYGISFKQIRAMDPNLVYRAISHHEVDVINGFSTDGRIPAYHLTVLQDDKHAFPPYEAAILIRGNILKKYPELQFLLNIPINTQDMQKLNYEVDVLKLPISQAVHNYLNKNHLL